MLLTTEWLTLHRSFKGITKQFDVAPFLHWHECCLLKAFSDLPALSFGAGSGSDQCLL